MLAEPAYDLEHQAYKTPRLRNVTELSLLYKPTPEFQELVQDVVKRRRVQLKIDPTAMVPLSEAIDNECRRRGITR